MSSHQTVVFLSNPSTDTTFENGLSVIFLPIQHSNVLALQVWVKTGSIHEGRWLGSGVSHFVEHMVFKGTEKRSYAEIFQEAQQQGAKLNAYTTFDRTVFTYDGGVESFSVGLDLLNDLVLHPTFPEEEWKKEREVILRENAMCQDDPEDRLSELLFAKAFRKHPYRYPVIGVRKIFERLTREDVQAYWRERYPVNNMTLVIAGNLPQEMVFEQVSRRWGSSRPHSVAPVFVQKEPLQLAERIEHVYGDYQVVRGEIGFRIPGLGHRDGAGLQVLATALGGGDSSVLYQKLREELHWVQEIDASAWMGDQHGLLFIHYACEADRRAPVEQWLREHISELAFQGLSQEVIDKTYRQAFLAELDACKTVSGQAHHVGWATVCLGDASYTQRYLEQLRTVTVEEIRPMIDRYLSFANATCVSLEPLSAKPMVTNATVVVSNTLPLEEETIHGVRLLYQPCPSFPKTHIELLCPAGSLYEPPSKRGLSQLLSTLLTKDTQSQSALEVASVLESIGAKWNGFSGNHYMGLSLEVLSTDIDIACRLLSNAWVHPQWNPSTFAIEKKAQLAEWKATQDDAFYVGFQRLRQHFFQSHPYAVGTVGTEASIQDLQMADVADFYSQVVRSNRTVLSVVSSLPKERIVNVLKPLCQALQPGEVSAGLTDQRVPLAAARFQESFSKQQAMVFQAYPMAGYAHEDFYIGEFLEEFWNGLASTFVEEVREKRGLAYTVGATRLIGIQSGMLALFVGTQSSQTAAVEQEMAREVQRVREGNITTREFETARTSLKVNRQLQLQSIGRKSFTAGMYALCQLPAQRWMEYDAAIDALDLDSFCERCLFYLQPSQATTLILRS